MKALITTYAQNVIIHAMLTLGNMQIVLLYIAASLMLLLGVVMQVALAYDAYEQKVWEFVGIRLVLALICLLVLVALMINYVSN